METESCPHCCGTGRRAITPASAFAIGAEVWWEISGNGSWCYGYPKQKQIPAVVQDHSKTGKRVRIAFRNQRYGRDERQYVNPKHLTLRSPDCASEKP